MESTMLSRMIKFAVIGAILCGIVAVAFFLQRTGVLGNLQYYFGRDHAAPDDARIVYVFGVEGESLGFFGKLRASFLGDPRVAKVRASALVGDAVEITGAAVTVFQNGDEVATLTTGGEPFVAQYRTAYEAVLRREGDGILAPREERIAFTVEHPEVILRFSIEPVPGITRFESDGKGGLRVVNRVLEIPEVLTGIDLPTGDAIASMTSVLQYWNVDAKKNALAAHLKTEDFYYQNGLLFGADPEIAFAGKPSDSQGWIVYEKPVMQATRDYLRKLGVTGFRVEAMEQPTESRLVESVREGIPLVVWQTTDLAPARFDYRWHMITTGEEFVAPVNLIVTVLHGFDDSTFFVMNPENGFQQVDRAQWLQSIESLGSRVIRVIPE